MKKTLSLLLAFMISVTMISPTLLAEDASVSVPPTDINNPLPVPIPASTEIKHAIPDSVNPSERVIIGNDDTRFWIDDTTV